MVKNEEAVTTEGTLPLIPLIAISGLVMVVAVVMFFIYKKNQSPKPSSKKEDMVSEIVLLSKLSQICKHVPSTRIIKKKIVS